MEAHEQLIMAELPETPAAVAPTPTDIDEFPNRLRKEIEATAGPQARKQRWVVIPAESRQEAKVIRETAAMAKRIAWQWRGKMIERKIELLADHLADGERAEVDLRIVKDNAELRARYVSEMPTYTAVDIHKLLHRARFSNPIEPALRWKRERRVFAVTDSGVQKSPCFQFVDGHPLPVIKDVLKHLPDDMTPWQVAFWFWSGKGQLGGKSPEEALNDRTGLLNAAARMREPAVG